MANIGEYKFGSAAAEAIYLQLPEGLGTESYWVLKEFLSEDAGLYNNERSAIQRASREAIEALKKAGVGAEKQLNERLRTFLYSVYEYYNSRHDKSEPGVLVKWGESLARQAQELTSEADALSGSPHLDHISKELANKARASLENLKATGWRYAQAAALDVEARTPKWWEDTNPTAAEVLEKIDPGGRPAWRTGNPAGNPGGIAPPTHAGGHRVEGTGGEGGTTGVEPPVTEPRDPLSPDHSTLEPPTPPEGRDPERPEGSGHGLTPDITGEHGVSRVEGEGRRGR
jgi:hypothetical protein